jgi:hypothetical protein
LLFDHIVMMRRITCVSKQISQSSTLLVSRHPRVRGEPISEGLAIAFGRLA